MDSVRRYIQSALLVMFACVLGAAAYRDELQCRVQIQEEYLTIPGVKDSYTFMLIADSHISLCDERDAALMDKAVRRREAFRMESGRDAERVFANFIQAANEQKPELTILAGDILDSAMYRSIDFVQKKLDSLKTPYLYILGNHDFEYGDEYFSKKAYREYFPRLEGLTGTKDQYRIVEYEDLVVIGINDKNNQLPKEAVNAALPYMQGDKPVILVLHVPLQPAEPDSALERQANEIWGLSKKGQCRVLLGESACRPNQTTQKLLDAVFAEDSPVAAVFAGHIHFYNKSMLDDSSQQLVTGAAYYGDAVYVHISGQS